MALVQVRVFDCRVVIVGEEPGPTETYVDGGDIECALEVSADIGVVNPFGGEIVANVETTLELSADIEVINPFGGEIRASIEAASEINADVEVVEP